MTPVWVLALLIFNSVLLLLLALAILFLYRQWGGMLLTGSEGINAHHGLRVGLQAPAIAGVDPMTSTEVTLRPSRHVLVFATAGCQACEEKANVFYEFSVLSTGWEFTYVLHGTSLNDLPQSLQDFLEQQHLSILIDVEGRSHQEYEIQASPFVMVIDDEGKVAAKGLVGNVVKMVQLLVNAGDVSLTELRDDLIEGRISLERDPTTRKVLARRLLETARSN